MDAECSSCCPSLAEAEALYDQARNCSTPEDAKRLLNRVNDRIKDYVSVSSSESCNPATYKILTNAVKLLESREKAVSARPSFSFKIAREKQRPSETDESMSQRSVGSGRKPDVPKADDVRSEPTTICLDDGKMYIGNHVNTKVIRTAEDLQGVGTVIMKNLERCRVLLLGVVETTYISNVKSCVVWIGISRASVILDSISESTVIVACSQLRITNSHQCKFLVDTVTAPIIESSSGILFAKNHVSYPGHVEQLETCGLKHKLLEVQNVVKDFSWHHDTASPNWRVEASRTSVTLAPCVMAGNDDGDSSNQDDTADNTVTFNSAEWQLLDNL